MLVIYAIGYSWRGGVNAFTSRTARGGYRLIDSTALTQRYGAGTRMAAACSRVTGSSAWKRLLPLMPLTSPRL